MLYFLFISILLSAFFIVAAEESGVSQEKLTGKRAIVLFGNIS